jgi:arylsulfatase A-like enzyme
MFNTQDWLESTDPMTLYQKTVELVQSRQRYPLSDAELTRLSNLYDACIRYVDAEIARLVATAEKRNGRRTVVVITSDHGDEFQEHGLLYHNNVVTEELIRVPLVVWRSGDNAPHQIDDLVRHVDVLPTLAEMIQAPLPSRGVGRSLVPLMRGEREESPRVSIAEGDYCSALVEPGWKVMRVDTTDADLLYDLVADPGGTRDIAALHPQRFALMRESLDLYFYGVPAFDPNATAAVDAATLHQLRALGYIN